MAQAIAVTGVILTAVGVAVGIGSLVVALNDGDGSLKSKDHWMYCTIRNETQFEILYNQPYWSSGTYYDTPPQRIPKFSAGVFSVCNKTGFAGVSGGNSWKLMLDDNTIFHFSLGYTDPVWGSRTTAAIESDGNPQKGYDAATERGCNGRSPFYKGKDADGNTTYFIIETTSVTGSHSTFTIQQSEIKGWQDP